MSLRDLMPWKSATPTTERAASPVAQLQREMNELFSSFWAGGWPQPFGETAGAFTPSVEVSETDKAVEVSAELPGMTASDVQVTLADDARSLVISGEKKFEEEREDKGVRRTERAYGMFRRQLPLPAAVDGAHAEASFTDGVLAIRMPKLPAEKQGLKTIPIK